MRVEAIHLLEITRAVFLVMSEGEIFPQLLYYDNTKHMSHRRFAQNHNGQLHGGAIEKVRESPAFITFAP